MEKNREYIEAECACFMRSKDTYGLLANTTMSGAGIEIDGRPVASTENLFHALKFPENTDLQDVLLFQCNSLNSKKIAYEPQYARWRRQDWVSDNVSFAAMRYCVGIKIAQHPLIVRMLMDTKDRPIVEKSYKDAFWGAKPTENGRLTGQNILGRLWMEARQRLLDGPLHPDAKVRQDFPWEVKGQEKLKLFGAPVPNLVVPADYMPKVIFPSSLPKDAGMFERIIEQTRLRKQAEEAFKKEKEQLQKEENLEPQNSPSL